MPSSTERRGIDFFIQTYNSLFEPKIVSRKADSKQESPDAVCELEGGTTVGLEHTSAFPPKGVNVISPRDLSPVRRILAQKFMYDYRAEGIDEVWLILQMRRTQPIYLVQTSLVDIVIPERFNRVYLQGPIVCSEGQSRLGLYELTSQELWYPTHTRVG